MRILFIHQNFPGQYIHQMHWMVKEGWEVYALAINKNPIPGVKLGIYKLRRGSSQEIHPWVLDLETKIIRAESCARGPWNSKKGLHPRYNLRAYRLGETIYIKDVWPDSPILGFMEFFYNRDGFDLSFDQEFQGKLTFEQSARMHAKNASNYLAWPQLDHGISLTKFQAQLSAIMQKHITIMHDGVDTNVVKPNPDVSLKLARGVTLTQQDEVITFINRNLEPYRGFPSFMRSLPKILKDRPKARVICLVVMKFLMGRCLTMPKIGANL